MKESVKITIEKQGNEITVSNSLGKTWTYPTNDSLGLVCALVANSCYDFFLHFDDVCESFTMSLTVTPDGQ